MHYTQLTHMLQSKSKASSSHMLLPSTDEPALGCLCNTPPLQSSAGKFSRERLYMTGPAKTGHVDTTYPRSHNRSYLSVGIEYLHSVTCIINPGRCLISVENGIVIPGCHKKLWVIKLWKSRQILHTHMPGFFQAWSQILLMLTQFLLHHTFHNYDNNFADSKVYMNLYK